MNVADDPINVLSVCSGAGGLDLGVRMAVSTARAVCYVEIEAYAVELLAEAMEADRLDPAPVWSNVHTFDGKPWRGVVDCLIGGYPCQPFSVAGHLLGRKDPRHLWPAIARLIVEVDPGLVFFENVAGHVKRGLREVRSDLQRMGYRVAAGLFRAEEVGANHRRERLFILGVSDRERLERRCLRRVLGSHEWVSRATGRAVGGPAVADAKHPGQRRGGAAHDHHRRHAPGDHAHGRHAQLVAVPDAEGGSVRVESERDQRQGRGLRTAVGGNAEPRHDGAAWASAFPPAPNDELGWRRLLAVEPRVEPAVRRDVDGLAAESHGGGVQTRCLCNRVDRLRICGNGVVPHQAAYALVTLAQEFA